MGIPRAIVQVFRLVRAKGPTTDVNTIAPIAIVKYFYILITLTIVGASEMGIVQLFGVPTHLVPASLEERAIATTAHPVACEVEHEPEQPVSFAEIVAASAFLDFGGLPAGLWSHMWRSSEVRGFQAMNSEPRPQRSWAQGSSEDNIGEKGAK